MSLKTLISKVKCYFLFPEFKIETQWVEELHGVEFPGVSMVDQDGRPARRAGFVRMSKESVVSTNASAITGLLCPGWGIYL